MTNEGELMPETMLVERDLLRSCLELFEDEYLPCDADCECIIHPLRAAFGYPDGPDERVVDWRSP